MEIINTGIQPNDGTGDPLRDAIIKVNENFALIKQPDWDEVDTESLAYIKNKPDIPEPVNQIDLFLELNDTPNSYEGQAGKIPTVKQDETGLVFAAAPQSGVDTFLELTDTPDAFTGQAGKVARVKQTEDGLEFGAPVEFLGVEVLTEQPTELWEGRIWLINPTT